MTLNGVYLWKCWITVLYTWNECSIVNQLISIKEEIKLIRLNGHFEAFSHIGHFLSQATLELTCLLKRKTNPLVSIRVCPSSGSQVPPLRPRPLLILLWTLCLHLHVAMLSPKPLVGPCPLRLFPALTFLEAYGSTSHPLFLEFSFLASRTLGNYSFISVQLLSHVWLFATPWTAATPGLPVHLQLPEFT